MSSIAAALAPLPPPTDPLLTAAEFLERYGHLSGVELVRGRVVWASRPTQPGRTSDLPNLVLEVRSPTDRWNAVFIKVGEYLRAGVTVVLVVDPGSRTVSAYRDDGGQQTFRDTDALTVPDVLPGFAVPVARLFEPGPG